jgi:hypothetical protein
MIVVRYVEGRGGAEGRTPAGRGRAMLVGDRSTTPDRFYC